MRRYSNFTGWLMVPLLLLLDCMPALAQSDPPQRLGGERWGANYFPNVPLTTHEGKTVRFFEA